MKNIENKFHSVDDLKLDDIQKNEAIKTNHLIAQKNFKTIIKWFNLLRDFMNSLYDMIDIDNLIAEVIKKYEKSKNILYIKFDMNIGEIVIQTMNQRDFQIKKIDLYIIEITCLSETNWDVNRLIVQIKNIDGTIVYPKIITIESKILIDFIDGIATNYQVIFI
jgi:uncharacterized protein YeeX (DUF496 family)